MRIISVSDHSLGAQKTPIKYELNIKAQSQKEHLKERDELLAGCTIALLLLNNDTTC